MRACKYCDGSGKHPIQKNADGYIAIEHKGPCMMLPYRDRWVITFWQHGIGFYAPIAYCPNCGARITREDA